MFSLNARLAPPVVKRSELGPAAEPGHGHDAVGRLDLVLFARRKDRLGQLGFAENSWARHMFIILDEHRVECEVAAGLLGVVRGFLVPFLAGQRIAGADECEQAVVIGLLIILDQRMVVALGALHVAAEEDPADVAGDQVGLGAAIEKEPRGARSLGSVPFALKSSLIT